MKKIRNPPAVIGTAEGSGNVDQAGTRVDLPYASKKQTGVRIYSFFEAYGFLHSYGPDRPQGKGWFIPDIDAVDGHWVRSIRRRRRR
jgi:hypothetical protein